MPTGMKYVAAAAVLCATSGCLDPHCPKGYNQIDDRCYLRKDAGTADAGDDGGEVDQRDADRAADDPLELEPVIADTDAGDEGTDAGQEGEEAWLTDASSSLDGGEANDAAAADADPVTCASNPCQNGGSCTEGPRGFRCSCPQPLMGERCEAWTCTTTTLRSEEDLARARPCAEIDGDLIIASAGIAAITESDLPYLTRVIGNLSVSGTVDSPLMPLLRELTLTKLREIGGQLSVYMTGPNSLRDIRFPALTRVGGLHFHTTDTRHLGLPALRVVGQGFYMYSLRQLCTLELGAIEPFDNVFFLSDLVNLPASALDPVRHAFAGFPILDQGIGCCHPTDRAGCPAGAFTEPICGCSAP